MSDSIDRGDLEKEQLAAVARTLFRALLAIMEAHGPGTLASDEIYSKACDALLIAHKYPEVSEK